MTETVVKRKTLDEKLAICKEDSTRMGLDEMALELNKRFPDLTNKDSRAIVESIFEIIEGSLKSGRNVIIRGFGTFNCRERAARRVHNPSAAAGAPNAWKEVGPSTAFRFKPGLDLKPVFK